MLTPSKYRMRLGWSSLILSVALHIVLLRLPMRPLGTLQIPEPEPPEVVPVTRLPVVASLPDEPAEVEPVSSEPEPQPEPVTPEPVTQPFDEIVVNEAAPPQIEAQADPETPNSEPPDSEPITPNTPNQPEVPPLEAGAIVPFADDFPHRADAQMGCYGLSSCGSLANISNFRSAARQLVPDLESQGYQVDEYNTDESGYLVYQLSHPDWRNGEPYYLSIFQDGLGQAVYVITQEVITLAALKELV